MALKERVMHLIAEVYRLTDAGATDYQRKAASANSIWAVGHRRNFPKWRGWATCQDMFQMSDPLPPGSAYKYHQIDLWWCLQVGQTKPLLLELPSMYWRNLLPFRAVKVRQQSNICLQITAGGLAYLGRTTNPKLPGSLLRWDSHNPNRSHPGKINLPEPNLLQSGRMPCHCIVQPWKNVK